MCSRAINEINDIMAVQDGGQKITNMASNDYFSSVGPIDQQQNNISITEQEPMHEDDTSNYTTQPVKQESVMISNTTASQMEAADRLVTIRRATTSSKNTRATIV